MKPEGGFIPPEKTLGHMAEAFLEGMTPPSGFIPLKPPWLHTPGLEGGGYYLPQELTGILDNVTILGTQHSTAIKDPY